MSDKESLNNQLMDALLKDRKADRRWKVIRSFVWAFLVLLYAVLIFTPGWHKGMTTDKNQPYVSLLRLNGEIKADSLFSAEKVVPNLIRAFRDENAKGVVLVINSPGGSPVQASIIHDRIVQLKKKYKKEVVVVGQDSLASGAYLVATAADKIYVNKDTLTGSIGVIMSGFGFTDAIQKIGVTRRVYTAGTNKNRLDPFEPVTPEDKAKIKTVLDEVHQDFINDVVQGRGDRLKGNKDELFSGDFWTGSTAVKLGIADATGNTWDALQKEFNVSHFKNYSTKPSFVQSLLKGAETELHLALSQKNNSHLDASMP